MPPVGAFDRPRDYAATLNHESVHATMAAHLCRLRHGARSLASTRSQPKNWSLKSASILGCLYLRLPPQHIHDPCVLYWSPLQFPADDKRAFLTAAAQAQVAVDWLLAKSPSPFAERRRPPMSRLERIVVASRRHPAR